MEEHARINNFGQRIVRLRGKMYLETLLYRSLCDWESMRAEEPTRVDDE